MALELVSALCLVAVLEGLFLFVAPGGWKRAIEQMHAMPNRQLRVVGAVVAGLGLVSLWWVRQ
ncbi:DUF2065 domain-containing protein [Lysobacter cavernae]|uniref:DUF2065 domain-containing protein n=1 Tax=Lysobacter cavernae TaxID=1685901 RepID=A0ABV7RNA1_9GAMM